MYVSLCMYALDIYIYIIYVNKAFIIRRLMFEPRRSSLPWVADFIADLWSAFCSKPLTNVTVVVNCVTGDRLTSKQKLKTMEQLSASSVTAATSQWPCHEHKMVPTWATIGLIWVPYGLHVCAILASYWPHMGLIWASYGPSGREATVNNTVILSGVITELVGFLCWGNLLPAAGKPDTVAREVCLHYYVLLLLLTSN